MSAPSAMALATSIPLRTPPLPITEIPGIRPRLWIDSGVGTPQSAKTSPISVSSALAASILAQLVPPTPAVSMIPIPAS